MKNLIFSLLSFLSLLPTLHHLQAQPCKEVVGYYAGWQWYDRNKLMNPQSVQYNKYTIINYSFFKPKSDGSLTISDPWGDKNQLLGPINWATAPAGYDTQYDFGNPAYHQPNQKMSDYVHQGGAKFLISIGGWTYSGDFPTIAASATKRAIFAHNCNVIVKLYNLDGIDIDWEYPGFNDGTSEHTGIPADKQNYTILLQQMRDSLDAIEPMMGRQLLLTAAVGAAPARQADVEWNNVKNILDIINVMTYDYYGAFDPITNHNAPLYPPAVEQPGFSCQESMDNLLALGVPANKLVMGAAFYGRSQMTTGTPGLHVQGNGQVDGTHFSADEGSPQYYNILDAMPNFDYHWDAVAQVPYLTGKTTNSFLSYDDEMSIEKKAQFINLRNLRGAIIWEISGDLLETSTGSGVIGQTPLIDKLNSTFCNGSTDISHPKELQVSIYPNPAQTQVGIFLKDNVREEWTVNLMDIQGKSVLQSQISGQDYQVLNIEKLTTGVYFLQIQGDGKVFTNKLVKE